MTPSAQVHLERRIAEERMIALAPPFERPDWLWEVRGWSFVPHAITMDASGALCPHRELVDEVDWTRVTAVRLETQWGGAIDLDEDDDDDWGTC